LQKRRAQHNEKCLRLSYRGEQPKVASWCKYLCHRSGCYTISSMCEFYGGWYAISERWGGYQEQCKSSISLYILFI